MYRELHWNLPDRVEDPQLLPVTGKAALMARFDDRVTVTRARAGSVCRRSWPTPPWPTPP